MYLLPKWFEFEDILELPQTTPPENRSSPLHAVLLAATTTADSMPGTRGLTTGMTVFIVVYLTAVTQIITANETTRSWNS